MVASVNKNLEFAIFLKDFEKDVLAIPQKCCVIVCSTVANRLTYLFDNYVDIYSMSNSEIENFLKEVKRHTHNYHVNMFILAGIMSRLRDSKKYQHQVIGQQMVNNHLFNRH